MRDVVLILGVLMAIISIGFGFRRNPFGADHDGEVARWIIGLGTGMGLTIAGLAVAVWPGDSDDDLVVVDSLTGTSDSSGDPSDPDGAMSDDDTTDDAVTDDADAADGSTTSAAPSSPGVSIAELALTDTAESCAEQATAVVLGTTYREVWGCQNSSRYSTEGYAEFDLGTRFSTFAGFVAVTDSSPSATLTRVEVSVGDEVVYSGDLRVGDRAPLEVDVSGAVRMTLTTERIENDAPAMVVLVGELDGQGASEVASVAPEPGGSGESIVSLGLTDTAESCGEVATAAVLGTTYREVWACENSSRYSTEGYAEFDLGTRYSTFAGFVAVTDTSPMATLTRVELSVGDEVVYSGDLSVGDRVPLDVDVSGAVRMILTTERIENDVPATVVLVGELDGDDSSTVIGPSPEPGGTGVALATRGLADYAVSCGEQTTVEVQGEAHRDVWGCQNSSRYSTEGDAEFNLGTVFSTFSGFVAVSDSSPSATVTRAEVSVGGEVVYQGDLSVGDKVDLEFDVTGEVRISLHTERIENDEPALVVLVGELSS